MRSYRYVVIAFAVLCIGLLVHGASQLHVATGSWGSVAQMTTVRAGAASVLLPDGRVLITGGSDANGNPLSSTEFFNTDGTFSPGPTMSTARSGHAAVWLVDGEVVVTGGTTNSQGGVTNSAEILDPMSGAGWSPLASPMLNARSGHTMTPLGDGSLLIAGGVDGSGAPVSALEVLEIAPSELFAHAGSLQVARKNHAAAALPNGRVLIVGGSDANGATLASTEIYDSASGLVSSGPALSTPRTSATATSLLDGKVLIAGGSYAEGVTQTDANGTTTQTGPAELASMEIYDPASGTITSAGAAMSTGRSGHQAFLLPNNNSVLLVGGTYNGQAVATADLYTPWTGGLSASGSMNSARAGATGSGMNAPGGVVSGIDGLLLVAGGTTQQSGELYGFATVKTDKADYSPGQPVQITGSGYQPGEAVLLTITQDDGDPAITYSAQADSTGSFGYSGFAPDSSDYGTHFRLTAVGQSSGLQAQVAFSDATNVSTFDATCTTKTNSFNFGDAVCAKATGLASQDTYQIRWRNPSNVVTHTSNGSKGNFTETYTPNAVGVWTVILFDVSSSLVADSTTFTIGSTHTTSTSLSCAPSSVGIGQPSTCTATVTDLAPAGQTTPTGNVSFSSNATGTFSSSGACSLSGSGGQASCSVQYTPGASGSATITGSYAGDSSHISSSDTFVVTVLAPSKLAFISSPITVTAGSCSSALTVQSQDSTGNPANPASTETLAVSANPSTGASYYTDSNCSTAVTGTNLTIPKTTNTATFYFKDTTAGSPIITVTGSGAFAATGANAAVQTETVSAPPATQLAVSTPASATSGTAFNFTVTAKDENGNVATGYTGTVKFTSSDTAATLPANYTFVSADHGAHTFSATLKTSGLQSLTGTDTVTSTISGTQSIQVTAGSAASIVATAGTPQSATVNTAFAVNLQAMVKDAYGNAVSGAVVTFTAPASGASGSFAGGVTTATTNASGVATAPAFTANGTAGIYTVAASVAGVSTAANFSLTNIGVPPQITSGASTAFTAGSAGSFTVTTSGTPTPSLGASGTLPAGISFHDNHDGTATISGTTTTAGSFPIMITAQNGINPNATQNFSLTVNPGEITHLVLSPSTSTIKAGQTQSYTALGLDAYNNPAGDVTASTTFAINAPASCSSAACGSKVAGVYTVTGTYAGVAQGQAQLTITSGDFTQLQLLVPGETAAPGTDSGKTGTPNVEYVNGAFNVTVNAVDQYFNLVNTVIDTVSITSNDSKAQLPADAALAGGTGSFSVTLMSVSDPATTTITASDNSDTSRTASTSPAIKVIIVYTATIAPANWATAQEGSYTLTVNNQGAPNTNTLSSVVIDVPAADQGSINNVSVTATQQGGSAANWSYDATKLPGKLRFSQINANDAVTPGGTITITFRATSNAAVTNAPITETWNTTAFADDASQNPLPLGSDEPAVSLGAAPQITSGNSTSAFTYAAAGSTFTVTATGIPTPKLSVGAGFPQWATFKDNGDGTATISGTPSAAGTSTFTITAHSGYGNDATQNFSLTVNKAKASIVVTPYSVTYDGNEHIATGTATGVSGESLSGLNLDATKHTNAGTFNDSWTFTDATGNYYDDAGSVSDSIAKANAQVSVTGYSVTYDGQSHTATGSVRGVKNETLSGLDLAGTTHTNAGAYNDSWAFTDSTGNYNNATGSVNDSIAKAQVTAAAGAYSGQYDATAHAPTACVVSGNYIGHLKCANSPALVGPGVSSGPVTPIVSGASVTETANFAINPQPGSFSITPAPLTITAVDQSMDFGGTAPSFTVSYSAFKGTDTPQTAVTTAATLTVYSDNPPTSEVKDFSKLGAGTYPIVATNAVAPNYSITYVNGTLTVNKAKLTGSITITPSDPTTVKYGQNVTATVYLNQYNIGGIDVLQSHKDPNDPNNPNLLPPSMTVWLVPVGGGPSQAVKFGTANAVPTYDNTTSTSGTTKTGWAALITTGKAPVPGNYYAFVYGDDPGDNSLANFNLADGGYFYADTSDMAYPTLQSQQLDVIPADLTITANPASKTYGDTVAFTGTEFTPSGLVNSDAVTSVTLTSAGAAATATVTSPGPTYAIVPSQAVGSGLTNYNITYVNGTLTVNPAALTITAKDETKTLGQAFTFAGTEFSSNGLKNSDAVNSVTLTSAGTPTSAAVGSYPIVPSAAVGTGLGNYTITYANGTMKVVYASIGMCAGDYGHQILQPINADGSSTFKQGSTVPAKFRVCDINGNSVGTVGVVASFRLVQTISGTTTGTVDEAVVSTTPDSAFRWDPTAQQWIFNISTKPLAIHTTYYYAITLNDGSQITFHYGLPK